MMNDRELTELAANAAKIDGKWGVEPYIERNEGFIPEGWGRAWSPLRNNDDAFKLAITLHIRINYDAPDYRKYWTVIASERSVDGTFASETGEDEFAAARRAIVRVAAAMALRNS